VTVITETLTHIAFAIVILTANEGVLTKLEICPAGGGLIVSTDEFDDMMSWGLIVQVIISNAILVAQDNRMMSS